MPTLTYQEELAHDLRQQLLDLGQHLTLPLRTVVRVATNVEYLTGGQRFAGWLRLLPNGQVVLLVSTYAPDSQSWAFHLHLVSSEGHFTVGHLLAKFTEGAAQNELFIGDFSLSADYRNTGTGSWVMSILFAFCHAATVGLVTGKIGRRDWDRVEKLERFYTKHGFTVTPNEEPKCKDLRKVIAASTPQVKADPT